MKGILPTLQTHSWNNSTHGGCQLGSGDLGLLPLTKWPTIVLLAIVWAPWLLMGCPCHRMPPANHPIPSNPTPSHLTSPPLPPIPSIINTDSKKGRQKYQEIQPSEIKVSYNKNQKITKYIFYCSVHRHNTKLRLGFCN